MASKHNYKGLHLFDPIIEIDRINATLDRYEDIFFFERLVLSKTRSEYLSNLHKLMQSCPASFAIRYNLNRVMRLAPKMIFGCIQTD